MPLYHPFVQSIWSRLNRKWKVQNEIDIDTTSEWRTVYETAGYHQRVKDRIWNGRGGETRELKGARPKNSKGLEPKNSKGRDPRTQKGENPRTQRGETQELKRARPKNSIWNCLLYWTGAPRVFIQNLSRTPIQNSGSGRCRTNCNEETKFSGKIL
jgi:hypothetical protein